MSKYNKDLDVCLGKIGSVKIGDLTYNIHIYQYDGGDVKAAIEKVFSKNNGTKGSASLGSRIPLSLLSNAKFMALLVKASEFVVAVAEKKTGTEG